MAYHTREKIVRATKGRLKKAGLKSAPGGVLKKTVTKRQPAQKVVKAYPARRKKKREAGILRYKTVKVKKATKRKVKYNAIPIFPRL